MQTAVDLVRTRFKVFTKEGSQKWKQCSQAGRDICPRSPACMPNTNINIKQNIDKYKQKYIIEYWQILASLAMTLTRGHLSAWGCNSLDVVRICPKTQNQYFHFLLQSAYLPIFYSSQIRLILKEIKLYWVVYSSGPGKKLGFPRSQSRQGQDLALPALPSPVSFLSATSSSSI